MKDSILFLNNNKYLLGIIIFLGLIIIYYNKNCNYNINEKFNQEYYIKIYYFYAEWCPHCQEFKSEWKQFCKLINKNNNIKIIEINDCKNIELCKQYNIIGYPTIIIKINNKYEVYNGMKKADVLYNYIIKKTI